MVLLVGASTSDIGGILIHDYRNYKEKFNVPLRSTKTAQDTLDVDSLVLKGRKLLLVFLPIS